VVDSEVTKHNIFQQKTTKHGDLKFGFSATTERQVLRRGGENVGCAATQTYSSRNREE
jgi:hypothetical protein